jgi:GntR family transcriptional regulator/MocR family aminotransferase
LRGKASSAGRVLYVGTFSKVLFPGLRLGYLVAPAALAERLVRGRGLLGGHQSSLDQMTVADFMAEGHFARHVKQMRRLYGERRAALAAALTGQLGDRLTVELPPGGMHLLARPLAAEDDVALARRARERGLAVESLSPLSLEGRGRPGLMLSFTNILVESAEREVRRLHEALFDR